MLFQAEKFVTAFNSSASLKKGTESDEKAVWIIIYAEINLVTSIHL